MFQCPYCRKTIEIAPPRREPVPWYQYDPGNGVSLGCGTLILIAIIVAMFSRNGVDSDDIRRLRDDIRSVEQKLDDLAQQRTVPPAMETPAE
jgi:hypothetical protein